VAFNVWDIGGPASMSTVTQCFFTDKALYVVIWNLALGEEAVANLQTWLLNIEVNSSFNTHTYTHKCPFSTKPVPVLAPCVCSSGSEPVLLFSTSCVSTAQSPTGAAS